MKFRDFVEVTRDGLESVAFGLEGDRDLSPMLHLESELGVSITGIDPGFFESLDSVQLLVARYVLPLIAESHARKVAWSYCVWAAPRRTPPSAATHTLMPAKHPDRRELLLASFIDPEVVEHWSAPIIRTGGPLLIGPWEAAIPNIGGGPHVAAVQEALR